MVPGVFLATLAAFASAHQIHLFPPSLTSDSAEYAAATTQVLVDLPEESALLSTKYPIEPLADRAAVYARLAASPAIRDRIGRRAGIDPAAIDVSGPYNPNAPRALREPTAERRATQLEAEQQTYRLRFDTEASAAVPVVMIYAQAPTVRSAIRLADSASYGLTSYLESVQDREGLSDGERLRVQPLGHAVAGVVNPGVDRQIAVLVFAATLMAWTFVVLLVNRLITMFRAAADPSTGEPGRRSAGTIETPAIGSRG